MNLASEAAGFRPDYAVPPGKLIEEYLRDNAISARELARRCGRSAKLIVEIMAGKAPVEPETALQLERVTEIDASIWLAFETKYRLQLARELESQKLTEHLGWGKRFPLKALQDRGFIPQGLNPVEKLRAVLRFFGVGSVDACKARCSDLIEADYRTSGAFESGLEPLAVWLRIGELRASQIETEPYDRAAFLDALRRIRLLTQCPISEARDRITHECASAGVAFVLEEPVDKVVVSGVSKWLSPRLAMIQQSLRFKKDDHFWFTFFHEAAHILLHSRKGIFIDLAKGSGSADPKLEAEANDWASDFLIPRSALLDFMTEFRRTEQEVVDFATRLGIAPGIVVGQLQHRKVIGFHQMSGLRASYDWCDLR
jgi:addiction module HigA family antidote